MAFAYRVNMACVEVELGKFNDEQFTKIEDNNDVTLEQLSEECQRLFNLKHVSAMIES